MMKHLVKYFGKTIGEYLAKLILHAKTDELVVIYNAISSELYKRGKI